MIIGIFFLIVGDVASGLGLLEQNADILAFAKLPSLGIVSCYAFPNNA